MKCPVCRTEVDLTSPLVPFCSDRCKLIDLGNWSSERYVISRPVKPEDQLDNEYQPHAGDDEE